MIKQICWFFKIGWHKGIEWYGGSTSLLDEKTNRYYNYECTWVHKDGTIRKVRS